MSTDAAVFEKMFDHALMFSGRDIWSIIFDRPELNPDAMSPRPLFKVGR
ncbi:Uncharacterised protein [Mycobacteroides abscessus subsp. abscessus]|nr:Uncharacterised protein [Mycobacteroides abscessus subsp. abscessus]